MDLFSSFLGIAGTVACLVGLAAHHRLSGQLVENSTSFQSLFQKANPFTTSKTLKLFGTVFMKKIIDSSLTRVALFSSIIFWLILRFAFCFSHFRESHLFMKGRKIHKSTNPLAKSKLSLVMKNCMSKNIADRKGGRISQNPNPNPQIHKLTNQ